MKKYFTLILILLVGSLNAQQKIKIEIEDLKMIRGKWISDEDKNYWIEIKDSIIVEHYEKDKPKIFKYKIENDQLVKTDLEGGTYEYAFSNLSDDFLELIYLPRGNFLSFTKLSNHSKLKDKVKLPNKIEK